MENTTVLLLGEMPKILFSWHDYTIFCVMLGLSLLIGIYFGVYSKQDSTIDYLLGGKSMKVVPVAISLTASTIAGITILSVPADVYNYGSNYWWLCLSLVLIYFITCCIFLPVFFKLQHTSMYEYLHLRFDQRIRTLASVLFAVAAFINLPIAIYIPAMAFSQVTGIYIHLISAVVCAICIIYTTIGGLKAVVWTDTLQFFGIVGSCVAIFFIGALKAGGFNVVWEKSVQGQRLDLFNFSIDPTLRDGFWPLVIGGTTYWTYISVLNQGCYQKFISVPTLNNAKSVALIFAVGVIVLVSFSVFTGDIIYAKYSECDPLSTKQITRTDQLLPHFVMDVAGQITGLPGIFVAGVFSAGLSTLSAHLNTLGGTIYKDFITPFMPATTTEKRASTILKIIVVILGLLSMGMVFVVEQMGSLLQLSGTIQAISMGPVVGLFILGILFPKANSKGVLIGIVSSLIITSWLVIGNQWYIMKGTFSYPKKPLSTAGCDFNFNATKSAIQTEEPFILYRLSYWYFNTIGVILVVIIGLIASYFTKSDKPVNRDFISPLVYRFLPDEPPAYYLTVDDALDLVTMNSDKEL